MESDELEQEIGLTVVEVETLDKQFEKEWGALWDDVVRIADRFWRAGVDCHIEWHHLVMTAGNFKRQTPIKVALSREQPRYQSELSDAKRGEWIETPGVICDGLGRDEEHQASWKQLEIHGVGVPTATTLLAALWPGHHVIVDRRAISALVGLRGAIAKEKRWDCPGWKADSNHDPAKTLVSWDSYCWYRSLLVDGLGASARAVERALYQADRLLSEADRRQRRKRQPQPWPAYGQALKQAVEQFMRSMPISDA